MPLPLAAAIGLSAIPGLGSAILGGATKNRYKKDPLYKSQRAMYEMLDKQANLPFTEQTSTKSILRQIDDQSMKNIRRLNASAAIGGMTDEAKIAAYGKANNASTDAIARLLANADDRRKNLLREKLGLMQGMNQIRQQYANNNVANQQAIFGGLSNSLGSLLMGDAMGLFEGAGQNAIQ